MVFLWRWCRIWWILVAGFPGPWLSAWGGQNHGNNLSAFADIHVHFNWDQKELISAREVADRLAGANVAFTVVASTPTHLVRELKQVGGDRIVPFFSPYIHELGRRDWFRDPEVLRAAEKGLAEGFYRGIGEVHFMVGFAPKFDNAVFDGLLNLARQYDVPMLVHVDAGSEKAFLHLCTGHPDIRLIFAHAGGNLHARHVRRIVAGCDNVLVEFSARDPWRYGGLTDDSGVLLPPWRELVLEFPDRFATGTDPVWRVTKTQSWDESDEGWDHFDELLDYHRRWLAGLPVEVESGLRIDNARRFLGLD